MFSSLVGNWVRGQMQRVGRLLAKTNLSPNWFTVLGLLVNLIVAAVIASGNLMLGGLLVLAAGIFDMFDGAVARVTNRITRFGGFFDSTLDRYSEALVYLGLLIYYQRFHSNNVAILLIYATAIGSVMVSYSRARAEAAGVSAEVGLFARTERIVLLAFFLLINHPIWALWILAILTNVTTVQRIMHVWRVTRTSEQR